MSSFLWSFTKFSFFPLTLSLAVWFLDYLGISELLGKNTISKDPDQYKNSNTIFFLFSLLVGIWTAFLLYLSFIGLVHILEYSFPNFDVFLMIYAICLFLSFGALNITPVLIFSPLIGVVQALVGVLAHLGYFYLADTDAQFFAQLPISSIIAVGIVVGLVIRSAIYVMKGG